MIIVYRITRRLTTMTLRPPWTKLGRKLESAVRKALFTYHLIPKDRRVAVALSGGKDSLTLLLMLHAIRGRGFPNFDLIATHVSGAFSCGAGVDSNYIRDVCDELKIPLIVRETVQEPDKLSCYPCSRERRRLLFAMAKEHECDTVAFGHHRDDNAQTLLLNLLHKGECAGLLPKLPMEDYGVTIVRPLIFLSEGDIRSFSQTQGFARIVCRCPVGQYSMRRRVDQALEELEELFPHARGNLAHASLNYGSDKALRK